MDNVKFTQMKDGDQADYAFLDRLERQYTEGTADRLLAATVGLDKSLSGYQVTRLGHSVQSLLAHGLMAMMRTGSLALFYMISVIYLPLIIMINMRQPY